MILSSSSSSMYYIVLLLLLLFISSCQINDVDGLIQQHARRRQQGHTAVADHQHHGAAMMMMMMIATTTTTTTRRRGGGCSYHADCYYVNNNNNNNNEGRRIREQTAGWSSLSNTRTAVVRRSFKTRTTTMAPVSRRMKTWTTSTGLNAFFNNFGSQNKKDNKDMPLPPTEEEEKEKEDGNPIGNLFSGVFGAGGKKSASEEKSGTNTVSTTTTASTSNVEEEYEPDIVEKLFITFFGKPEDEPFGLKRFNAERFPEQYPATTTEFATIVDGDSADVAVVRPVLKNTNLEKRLLELSYNAEKDGWDYEIFHQKVDRKGPALVVCTTTDNLICGGYNPKGWVGYGEARGSIAAFLFCQNKDSRTRNDIPFIKLRKVGGAGLAQLDNPDCGPMFGSDALIIPLIRSVGASTIIGDVFSGGNNNPSKTARSKLGSYYERMPDGSNSLFGNNRGSVQLRSLKIYHGVWGPDEYIPFTDAEPLALT